VTARKPCGAWLDVVGKSDRILNLIPSDSDAGAVTLRVYGDDSWSISALDGCETVHLADGKGGQLAAEDAARDLLLGGLAVLGAGMPEGWRIDTFTPSSGPVVRILRDPEGVGVFVGDEAKIAALAIGMLAAVRK